MTLTLEPTQQFVRRGELMMRVWKGTTPHGIPCIALIAGVAVDKQLDQGEFERGLIVTDPGPLGPAIAAIFDDLGGK